MNPIWWRWGYRNPVQHAFVSKDLQQSLFNPLAPGQVVGSNPSPGVPHFGTFRLYCLSTCGTECADLLLVAGERFERST